MKKFTSALLAVTALSATVAMADAPVASATGFYLGGKVGVVNTNVKYGYVAQNVTAGTTGLSASDRAVNFKADAGKFAGLFGLFAGYGMQMGQAYLGAEIYGGFDTTNMSTYDDSATAKSSGYWKSSVTRKNFYGLAPRVGYFVTPSTMAYIRLGVEFGKWDAKVDPDFATIDFSGTAYFGTSAAANAANASKSKKQFKSSKSAVSFAPGLGLEVFMTKNLFMRAEYSYLFGPKINVSQDTSGYDNGIAPGSTYAHSFNISQHAVKIGVGYKF